LPSEKFSGKPFVFFRGRHLDRFLFNIWRGYALQPPDQVPVIVFIRPRRARRRYLANQLFRLQRFDRAGQ